MLIVSVCYLPSHCIFPIFPPQRGCNDRKSIETESMASDLSGIKDEDLLRKMVSDFNCCPLSLMKGLHAMIREATL